MGFPKLGGTDFGFSMVVSVILVINPFITPGFYRKELGGGFREVGSGSECVTMTRNT